MPDEAEVDVLSYLALPCVQWRGFWDTNQPEWLHAAAKRHTDGVGIFSNTAVLR